MRHWTSVYSSIRHAYCTRDTTAVIIFYIFSLLYRGKVGLTRKFYKLNMIVTVYSQTLVLLLVNITLYKIIYRTLYSVQPNIEDSV